MANSNHADGRMSWHEKELVAALKRLVVARERLQVLEEQAQEPALPVLDPADVARAHELQEQIAVLRQKVSGFRGGRYRDDLDALIMQERLVLDRLAVASHEELADRLRRVGTAPVNVVDPTVLEFARRELAAAEQAFLDVQTMDVPTEPEQPEGPAEGPSIDLRDDGGEVGLGSRTQSA
jgi:hypothetical protein